jgi:transposase InsO family protein
VEVIPTKFANDAVVIKFLEENILDRFGCPRKIITDNAQSFKSLAITDFCQKYNITLGNSIAYYPQGNGLAESSNKSLMRVIKKVLIDDKRACYYYLKFSLWANIINTKTSTCISPF